MLKNMCKALLEVFSCSSFALEFYLFIGHSSHVGKASAAVIGRILPILGIVSNPSLIRTFSWTIIGCSRLQKC